jgi:3-methylcrotonyl-CoA carboxylase alpha subunit
MIPKLFDKILIANRGEIALRIMRTARRMGIETVAIYAESDANAAHVRFASEAWLLGTDVLQDSYLNIEKIISIALRCGADAIHPGYGFLSENPAFARTCNEAGIAFIGPSEEAIRLMGNKIAAREIARKTGVPLIEGLHGTPDEIISQAESIGFPLLVKAAAGGGGKGMRVVNSQSELADALASTSREAKAYFNDGSVYVERYVSEPRHIEVQVLGDKHGNVIHVFERECSIQRRHQKIIEEAPSVTLNQMVREKMYQAAVQLAARIGYSNAGTIEFLVDNDLNFFFLEMNTRIQVEHPVTELISGLDLVEEQIRIAAGFPLRYKQDDIKPNGHAVECRIYAEDPGRNFMPSPGKISLLHFPKGKHIRNDSSLDHPDEVFSFFDPMISKLVTHGKNRSEAIKRMADALQLTAIHGISTNVEYLGQIINDGLYGDNRISTHYCEQHTNRLLECAQSEKSELPLSLPLAAFLAFSYFGEHQTYGNSIWEKIGYWRLVPSFSLTIDDEEVSVMVSEVGFRNLSFVWHGLSHTLEMHQFENGKLSFSLDGVNHTAFISDAGKLNYRISIQGNSFGVKRNDQLQPEEFFSVDSMHRSDGRICSPMPGKVIKVNVNEGDVVSKNAVLLVVEAMKMENNILAPCDGKVSRVNVKAGEMVDPEKQLVIIQTENNE